MQQEEIRKAIKLNQCIRPAEGRSSNCFVIWDNLLDLVLTRHAMEINFMEGGLNIHIDWDAISYFTVTSECLVVNYGGKLFWGMPVGGCSVTLYRDDCKRTKAYKLRELGLRLEEEDEY